MSKKILVLLTVAALMVMGLQAMAHDDSVSWSFGLGDTYDIDHYDDAPFKGWLNMTVTNSGQEAWGDFHLQITGMGIENVSFTDASMGGCDPISSQSPISWSIDNSVVGATMDVYFYDDPVLSGQTFTLSVWTDNPDQVSFFGVCAHPTPVPEPGTMVALGSGLVGLVGFAARRRK